MSTVFDLLLLLLIPSSLDGLEELAITPRRERASDWTLLNDTARVTDGELVLDGRGERSMAVYAPKRWKDLTLSAKFLVEPDVSGVLACGFVFRAADDGNYYYVHFDRTQAILVRATPENSWNEIKRVSNLEKPAGNWHHAQIEVRGDVIRVNLNGRLLFEAKDDRLKDGHIGFYANQGVAHVKDIVVTGEDRPSEHPFRRLPTFLRFVVKDAGAGGYEAFPDVCRLADGRLMCVYYAGYGHVSLPNEAHPHGGRINCSFSSDEGRTWSDSQVLYDGPHDDRDPSIVQLSDGTLLCNFFSLSHSSASNKSFDFEGSFVVSSQDGGKTWSAPRLINREHACSTPIRILNDETLMLGVYGDQDGGRAYGGVVTSKDQGRTWSPLVRMDNNGAHLDAETDVIQLNDGSLYAALRGGKGSPMHWSRSRDNGRTWSVCQSIGFDAHCPYLHRTVDGAIILGHRIPATSLHVSFDECQTWGDNIQVDRSGGAYPSMVNLNDDSVLIVFYEEGSRSNIRARRFRMAEREIKWLAFEDAKNVE